MLTHTCQGQLYFRTSEIINKVKVTDGKKKKKEDIFALNIKTILRLSSLFMSHKINCSSRCLKTTREIKGLKQNSNCYGERFVKINVDLSQFRCMPSSLEVQYYLVWFRSSVPGQIKLIRYAQSVFLVIFDEFVLIDQQRKLISVATIYEANLAPLRCINFILAVSVKKPRVKNVTQYLQNLDGVRYAESEKYSRKTFFNWNY